MAQRDDQNSENWSGWCELNDRDIRLITNDGDPYVMSRSVHPFQVTNKRNNQDLNFVMEYKHVFEKKVSGGWQEVSDDTKPDVRAKPREQGNFTCDRSQTYGHANIQSEKHWSHTRSGIDTNPKTGDKYRLRSYTLVTPDGAGGRAIKAQLEDIPYTCPTVP